jgi:hypothetical protein
MRNKPALAEILVCDIRPRVGRRKQWSEDMQARFAEGTFDRIARALADGEDRTDFVRAAVEAELKRREKSCPLTTHHPI